MGVSFTCEIISQSAEKSDKPTEAKVKINKKKSLIEFDKSPSNFYVLLSVAFAVLFMMSMESASDVNYTFLHYAGAFIGGLVIFMIGAVVISDIISPLQKFLYVKKTVDLEKDVMFAEYEVTEDDVTSVAKSAARLASMAMAGTLENQGKTSGSYLHLGIAALMNSNKRKKTHIVKLLKVDGSVDLVICKEKEVKHILENATDLPKRLWSDYMSLVSQAKKKPDLVKSEVLDNLKRLNDSYKKLNHIAENDPKSSNREAASAERVDILDEVIMNKLVLTWVG